MHAFQAAISVSEEAFWRWDLRTDRIRFTARWYHMLGRDPVDQEAGSLWQHVVHPNDHPRFRAEVAAVSEGVTPDMTLELRVRHVDGSYRWVLFKAVAEGTSEGAQTQVHALSGVVLDISERRRTQDVFERLVRHNALILDSAGDGIYCVDEQGKATFVNPAAARLLGASVSDLMGLGLCRIVTGCKGTDRDDTHSDDCPLAATLRTGVAQRTYDANFLRLDGSPMPIEYVTTPLVEQGEVRGAVVVFNDVSDRKEAERLVRSERTFSEGLVRSSLDGIVAFDRELCVTVWNPAMERLTGMKRRDVMGRPIEEALELLSAEGGGERFQATLEGRSAVIDAVGFEIEATGSKGVLQAYASPVRDESGIVGGLVVVRDITERVHQETLVRESREKLLRTEKLAALGTLVSGVAHELRTPMSYINNHLYLVKRAAQEVADTDPTMQEFADDLVHRADSSMRGIRRMAQLLDDLRATYKPDEGDIREVQFRDLVTEALRIFRGAYEGPVHVIETLDDSRVVRVEAGRVQQIVINLLNNAADAMGDTGGTVHVNIRSLPPGSFKQDSDGGVEIEFIDDGPGIDAETRQSIFKPFFTTKKTGSGLGLYLVKQIVDRHAGDITCVETEGGGATFRIRLPARGPPASEAADASEALAEARLPQARVHQVKVSTVDDRGVRR